MKILKTGDWGKARAHLRRGPARLKAAMQAAVHQEAHELRKEIVKGLTSQSPGGKSFEQLSPLTIAARRMAGFKGTKALIRRGDLRNAVAAIVRAGWAFVGVPKKARASGKDLVDIAALQENGSEPVVIPKTPRMKKFLSALLREAGVEPKKGSGKDVVIMRIPARPFLKPAFDEYVKHARKRFAERVARMWRG